ncbi:MAG: TraR/DksA C4-type zinc finger protein [Sulfurimonas sp.]
MKKREELNVEEFEVVLNERVQHIQENIDRLKEELGEVSSDDTINDMEDLASLETLNDNDRILLERQVTELKEIYHAPAKIKNRTYGICEETGKPIPVERLRANPIARYLVNVEK